MAKRISLQDVARAAEVSTSTVSLALAGDQRVASATRTKVEQAACALGYARSPLLASLAGSHFRHPGKPVLVAVSLDDRANGSRLPRLGQDLGMCIHEIPTLSLLDLPRQLAQIAAAALVINRRGIDPRILAALPLPVVLWEDENPGELMVDVVETSDWWGTILATLAQVRRSGYQRVAIILIAAQPRHWHDDVRLAAARQAGVPVLECLVEEPERIAAFLDQHHPEAVIGLIPGILTLLRQIGRPLPFASMINVDRPWCAGIAGMYLDQEHRWRTTFELIEQRLRYGPRPPRRIIIPPRWRDDRSLPRGRGLPPAIA